MSERTGLSVSQVTDEVLYAGLVGMQDLPELDECGGSADMTRGVHWIVSISQLIMLSKNIFKYILT